VRTESDIYVFLVIIRYDLVVCIQTFPNLALFRVLSKTRGRHLSTFDDQKYHRRVLLGNGSILYLTMILCTI